jgi:predicted phosphodiesterase
MECNYVDLPAKVGKKYHIHVFSDVHGNWDLALDEMKARQEEYSNSYFVLLGDNDDWILPKDPRFLSSEVPEELRGVDDYIDQAVDQQYKRLKDFKFLFVSMGNHDYEILNRHGTCPTARLARRLCCRYGGYSGFLRVRFRSEKTNNLKGGVTFLYHHGSSNAPVTEGILWAKRFAAGWEDWDVFIFGHTHKFWCHRGKRGRRTERNHLAFRDTWIVNTGTWKETYKEGGTPGYGERRGYPPVTMAAPMIEITPLRDNKARVRVMLDGSVGDA